LIILSVAATFFGVLMLLIGALAQWPNRAKAATNGEV